MDIYTLSIRPAGPAASLATPASRCEHLTRFLIVGRAFTCFQLDTGQAAPVRALLPYETFAHCSTWRGHRDRPADVETLAVLRQRWIAGSLTADTQLSEAPGLRCEIEVLASGS